MAAPQRKPQADIYTVLLVIAFVAIIAAIVFLYLETADYGTSKYSGAPPVARIELPVAPSLVNMEIAARTSQPRASVSRLPLASIQSLTPNS